MLLFYKRKPSQIFRQFRGLFKDANDKNLGFCIEKKKERNMNGKSSKTLSLSSVNTTKSDKKEKAEVDFLVSKSLNLNSEVKLAQ